MSAPQNREAWLILAAEAMGPWVNEVLEEGEMPPLRVSVGWPGGRAKKNVIGQCWPSTAAEDGIAQIFMSPVRGEDSTVDVLGTLLHEMIHAADDCNSGHRGKFARVAKALGFIPKLTSSDNRTEDLTERLAGLAERLGPFPHGAIITQSRAADQPKKQGTRMLKVECPEDGYVVRTTQKWLDVGNPTCPCGAEMEPA